MIPTPTLRVWPVCLSTAGYYDTLRVWPVCLCAAGYHATAGHSTRLHMLLCVVTFVVAAGCSKTSPGNATSNIDIDAVHCLLFDS